MVQLRLPRVLGPYCNGKEEIAVLGGTVRSILKEIGRDYPELYRCLCNEKGEVRKHVNLFVNDDLIRSDSEFESALEPDDVISVFQAVSGG